MTDIVGQFWAILVGLIIVAVYSWQRFNEPAFPNREALPHTAEPLRYLFLRPAYARARRTYVVASLLLYGLLLWPGAQVISVLRIDAKDFPIQAWALLVALVLIGVLPSTNAKWLTMLEEQLRRGIHTWFLVPDGVVKTIGVLEDAAYVPSARQLNAVASPLREQLQADLRLPPDSLRYRWARARMLMESLKQMGNGSSQPLNRSAFDPFREDLAALRDKGRLLAADIAAAGESPGDDRREALGGAVDDLLRRIYACISWGIWHQASSERDVDQMLQDLGFRIPPTGDRRIFDVVVPAVLLVALITTVFWIVVYKEVVQIPDLSDSVVYALAGAMAASIMYGGAVAIALNRRQALIEQKVWREASPRCLIRIAIRAGLLTWAVIIFTTVLLQFAKTVQAVAALVQFTKSVVVDSFASASVPPAATFLLASVTTALPWLLAGATVSTALAYFLGGDPRRTDRRHQVHDAIVMGIALGLAAASAQFVQASLAVSVFKESSDPTFMPIVIGLAGVACGAVIGFMVPYACRESLVKPFNAVDRRALGDLLRRAETLLGNKDAAETWVFTPRDEFGGITPAEAVHFKGLATGVSRLLEGENQDGEDAPSDQGDPSLPFIAGDSTPIRPNGPAVGEGTGEASGRGGRRRWIRVPQRRASGATAK